MDALLDLVGFVADHLPLWRFFAVLGLTALLAYLAYRQLGSSAYVPLVVGAIAIGGFGMGAWWHSASKSR